MKRTAQIVLAMTLLITAACHKDNKEAQLKALEEAYKSGVFSKQEYDAKRQALIGAPTAPAPAAPAPAAPVAAAPVPAPLDNPLPAAPPNASVAPPVAAPPVAGQSPAAAPAAPVPVQAPPPSYAPPVSAPPTAARQTAPIRQSAPPPQLPPQAVPQAAPPPPATPPPPAEAAEPEPAPLAGCQDAESRAGGPNGVQERFLPASEDIVRQAALQAFTNLDFVVHTSSGHEIEASKKRHLSVVVGAGGEKVILHFASARKDGRAGTRVTAETKKSITGKLAQKSWTTAVLAQIECNLRVGRR